MVPCSLLCIPKRTMPLDLKSSQRWSTGLCNLKPFRIADRFQSSTLKKKSTWFYGYWVYAYQIILSHVPEMLRINDVRNLDGAEGCFAFCGSISAIRRAYVWGCRVTVLQRNFNLILFRPITDRAIVKHTMCIKYTWLRNHSAFEHGLLLESCHVRLSLPCKEFRF